MRETLAKLREASEKLNLKRDAVTSALCHIENAILRHGCGVQTWIDTNPPSVPQLGWAKIGEEWCLATTAESRRLHACSFKLRLALLPYCATLVTAILNNTQTQLKEVQEAMASANLKTILKEVCDLISEDNP